MLHEPITAKAHTPSQVAEELGVPIHRVRYVLRSRAIRPAVVAGQVHVFTRCQVDQIRRALKETEDYYHGPRH